MQHALVQYLMDMQKGRDETRLDTLDTEKLREMREELTNLEPTAVRSFVVSELDKKLEQSFGRVPPDNRPHLIEFRSVGTRQEAGRIVWPGSVGQPPPLD